MIGQRSVLGARAGNRPAPFTSSRSRQSTVRPLCSWSGEKALFGENFGARDVRPGELESNFSEKVIGNWNTEHIIKPPEAIKKIMGLTSRSCQNNAGQLTALSEADITVMRNQVAGWKVATSAAGHSVLRNEWKGKDEAAAAQLLARVQAVADQEEHHPVTASVTGVNVLVELATPAVGGISENDFIVAAKVNQLSLTDLEAKKKARYWA